MATDVSWRHSAQQYARMYGSWPASAVNKPAYTEVDRTQGRLMNRIVYIVGLVVIILAVLAFFGFR